MIPHLLYEPTLPDAIQPKGPLRMAQMAVRDHIRLPMGLQYQTWSNYLRPGHNSLGSLQESFQANSQIQAMLKAIPQHELIDKDGP